MEENHWDRFKVIHILRSADPTRFGDLLLDYRKEYANNIEKYPADLQTMVDVLRQQPEKRRKTSDKPKPRGSEDKDKEKRNATSSFAQNDDDVACVCCEYRDCLLNRYKKESTIPKDQTHKPKYWKPEYSKKDRA